MSETKSLASWAIGGLAVVNVALALGLYVRSGEPTAYAQAGGRADVVVLSARYGQNNGAGVIVALDTSSGQLVVLRPNPMGPVMQVLDRHNAAADLQRLGGR